MHGWHRLIVLILDSLLAQLTRIGFYIGSVDYQGRIHLLFFELSS